MAGRLSIALFTVLALTVAGCAERAPPTATPSVSQQEGPPEQTDKAKLLEPTAPFRMPIDDAFALQVPGKVVVVGVVADGEVRVGARLLLRTATAKLPVTVEALEGHDRPLQAAGRGERVGIMLDGASKEQVGPGAVLVSAAAPDAEPIAAPGPPRK